MGSTAPAVGTWPASPSRWPPPNGPATTGFWTTEVSRDPFLPLLLAAGQSRTLTLGTAVAVAFARNPMTLAMVANDLQSFSSGRFVLGLGSQIKAHIQRRLSL